LKFTKGLNFNYFTMLSRGEEEEEGEEEEKEKEEKERKKGKRGRSRERPEGGNCDIASIYQFFKIEKDLQHGYDYRCILCSSRGLSDEGCIVAKCVGPTNLVNHMKRVHHFVSTSGTGTLEEKKAFFGASVIPKDKVSSAVLRLIIRDLRPFAIAESPGFFAFLKDMNLTAESHNSLITRMEQWHSNAIPAIKAFLETHLGSHPFSVSIDGWTSGVKRKSMYCMVIHFVTTTFDLISLPLDVGPVSDKTAEGIKEWIRKILSRYGLSFSQLFCVTSDEAATEECATRLIGCFRLPCVPHRLSNVVKTTFEEVGLAAKEDAALSREPLIEATKRMIKFINNKGAVRTFFEGKQANYGLRRKNQLYCPTRFIGRNFLGKPACDF
jgi:hypothetical protein